VGKEEAGYARLVLKAANLPAYEVKLSGSILILSFAEPLQAELGSLVESLPNYLSAARVDPDRRGLRLALKRGFRVNTIAAGDDLYVDLMGERWRGPPPGLPKEVIEALTRKAEAAEARARAAERRLSGHEEAKLAFTVARQPGLTRLSFAWTGPVTPALSREGNQVMLAFDRSAPLNLAPLLTGLPPEITAASASDEDERLKLRIDIVPSAQVRGFWDESTYVVDILGVPDPSRMRLAERGPEPGLLAVASRAGAEEAVTLPAPPPPGGPDPKVAQPTLPNAPEPPAAVPVPPPPTAPEPDEARSSPGLIRLQLDRSGPGPRLVIPSDAPAAVFQRDDEVWIVLDTSDGLDLSAVQSEAADALQDVVAERQGEAQLVRARLLRPALVTAAQSEGRWSVSLGDEVLGPASSLGLTRELDASARARALVDLARRGRVHRLRDRRVGDELLVATAHGPAQAVRKRQDFVEFTLLPSAQGVALLPKVDDIEAEAQPKALSIARPSGLNLTPGAARARFLPGVPPATRRPGPAVVAAEISGEGAQILRAAGAELVRAAAEIEDEAKRSATRMKLAELFVAHQLGSEALGVLRAIERADRATAEGAPYLMLAGIAEYLVGRPEAARALLAREPLAASPEAALWRAAAAAQVGQWSEVDTEYARGATALDAYPAGHQAVFRLAAARAALERSDFAKASAELAVLQAAALLPPRRDETRLLTGRLDEALGRAEKAAEAYRELLDGGMSAPAAEARLRLAVLRNRSGELDATGAIAELRGLSVAWRGDEIEAGTLRRLGALEAERGDHRAAFATLDAALKARPESAQTRDLQDEMAALFSRLFADGEADTMPALEALALFYDFQSLVPSGRRGDEMIRRMADRLVEIDLLPQAANLLEHQVFERLRGAERAQVAAKLALVHLLNRKPMEALRVLERTRLAALPAEIHRQRALLEARGLIETGRIELALELLEGVDDPQAGSLAVEALWSSQAWQKAAERIELNFADRHARPEPLADAERHEVLRAAIAYALTGDTIGLNRLRTKFSAKLADSPDAAAFRTVTEPGERRGAALQGLLKQVTSVDILQGFLAAYRARYFPSKAPASAALDEKPTRS